jgi:hypothetical protein
MDKVNKLIKEIQKVETERYNRCSHPTSDKFICLTLSYELWHLKVMLQNLKK